MYISVFSIGGLLSSALHFSTGKTKEGEKKGSVNQILESLKKIGATLIVIALILIMGISFSSQDMSEILTILSGGSKIGSYRGEEIRPEVYGYAEDSCKNRYQVYGEIPQVFIDQCASDAVRDMMVMPAIVADLGLDVSEKQIQDQIISVLRTEVEMQNQSRLADDRLSLEQMVQREMSRFPMSLRMRLTRVGLFQDSVAAPFPVSAIETQAFSRAKDSAFELNVIAFTNADLLNSFSAEASEAEMKDLYEKDKKEAEIRAKKEKKEGPFTYPSFEERKEFLKDRVLTEKKKKQLEELKASLGQKKDASLATVSEKTGYKAERATVKFSALNAVSLASGKTINLTGDRFLSDVAASRDGLKGPYQDGETTIYLTIEQVKLAPPSEKLDPELSQNRAMYLSYAFANQIVKEYAETGKFRLTQKSLDSGKPE